MYKIPILYYERIRFPYDIMNVQDSHTILLYLSYCYTRYDTVMNVPCYNRTLLNLNVSRSMCGLDRSYRCDLHRIRY